MGRNRLAIATLALVAALAVGQHWLADLRPPPLEQRAVEQLAVTSPADRGPGSLRRALFAAAAAPHRVRIQVLTPSLVIDSPLPPLINPHGVVLAGGGAVLDAGALFDGAALDVDAPGSVIRDLTVRGAGGAGILVRAPRVRLSELTLERCREGVRLAAEAAGGVIEKSRFADNEVGLVWSAGTDVLVEDNRFSGHAEAGVWAVAADTGVAGGEGSVVRGNRFEGDLRSMVLANVAVRVEDNELVGAGEAGIYLIGSGATVEANRIRRGERFGVYAEATRGARIAGNEVDANEGVGILVHSGRNTVVRENRAHVNGYGIVIVFGDAATPNVVDRNLLLSQRYDALFVLGGAPVLRSNRALGSGDAGLRLVEFQPWDGEPQAAAPLLVGNTFERNGSDTPLSGVYREPPPEDETDEASEAAGEPGDGVGTGEGAGS